MDIVLNRNPGYHLDVIPKGCYGTTSKVLEEVQELLDAEKQGSSIMMLCEMADIYGALDALVISMGLKMTDLETMSLITRRAFQSGERDSK